MYLEIKYTGGTKIRATIDKYHNLLEIETLEEENREIIINILDKIRNKKINPIFDNTYKRLSFIYKNNPSMRITIDTNIEFFKNKLYNIMDTDILEFKIPNSISIGEAEQFLKEINMLADTKLQFSKFSKFEYYYYNVILKQ
jgi:SPX domain protein involved in polyphosphate accumulation